MRGYYFCSDGHAVRRGKPIVIGLSSFGKLLVLWSPHYNNHGKRQPMLLTVDFVSRVEFETIAPADDLAVVSIGNPAELPPRQLDVHTTWLRMEFLDCDLAESAKWGFPLEALCTQQHVLQMAQFISKLHMSERHWRLVVHCHQGTSRSAAVALVACALTGCDMPRRAESLDANPHVLRVAIELLGLRAP